MQSSSSKDNDYPMDIITITEEDDNEDDDNNDNGNNRKRSNDDTTTASTSYEHYNRIAEAANRLNNQAIQYLQQKQYSNASNSFLNAIHLMKQIAILKDNIKAKAEQRHEEAAFRDNTSSEDNTSNTNNNTPPCLFLMKDNHVNSNSLIYNSSSSITSTSTDLPAGVEDEHNSVERTGSSTSTGCRDSSVSSSSSTGTTTNDDYYDDDSNTSVLPFIFPCPLYIPSHHNNNIREQTCSSVVECYYVKLSFTLIYNFALCKHLHHTYKSTTTTVGGEESTNNQDNNGLSLLESAMTLYEGAYEVFMDQQESMELSILHTMAIQNNLGQVYQSLGYTELAHDILQDLLVTVMFVRNQDDYNRNYNNDDDDNNDNYNNNNNDLDGFIKSVLFLILHDKQSAPAA